MTQRNPASKFIREIDKKAITELTPEGSYKTAPKPSAAGLSISGAGGVGSAAKSSADTYNIGEMVIHPKFGAGMVIQAVPMGNDSMLEIAFEEVGTKKLMAAYARLKKA
jgi:DNA helicase-2/ATP-dependent DNA helicase PcrA